MTRTEFDAWIESHYRELIGKAREFEAKSSKDAVQDAVLRALENFTDTPPDRPQGGRPTTYVLRDMSAEKLWPWMVDAVRGVVANERDGTRRAVRARRKGQLAFISERSERGTHNRIPIPALHDTPVEEDAGRFSGPSGWAGEYSIAHVGRCKCGGEQFSRAEVGRDTDRRTGNKALARRLLDDLAASVKTQPHGGIERLAAFAVGCVVTEAAPIRQQWHALAVLGCTNGQRAYTGALPIMRTT